MIKKLYPLCENHVFSKAYRKGKCNANKYVAVYALKNYGKRTDRDIFATKLGITVNKKLGSAVKRSRVKRIIRAAYRELLPKTKSGFVIIIAARTAIFGKGVKTTDIVPHMKKSFEMLGLISEQDK